ncbi:hypothetical protein AX774_g2651 [Zancudomyces culisetae]|uniref:Uncharacterized protein n=1 Tax=Zancudomyces culisetae TaxID=1213189 RepID=A0A1R1PSB7_ZANCU|nr:hypothetical protein AX774_g2651 [Zancudomyces culisetae]|eukprot:OMH83841.1 hypothetical protein AX774_g2651 [Zancudomyces culisetae]
MNSIIDSPSSGSLNISKQLDKNSEARSVFMICAYIDNCPKYPDSHRTQSVIFPLQNQFLNVTSFSLNI